MVIKDIFDGKSVMTEGAAKKCPVVLMTRVRLARNLSDHPFPGWAKLPQKKDVLETSLPAVATLRPM